MWVLHPRSHSPLDDLVAEAQPAPTDDDRARSRDGVGMCVRANRHALALAGERHGPAGRRLALRWCDNPLCVRLTNPLEVAPRGGWMWWR